MFTETLSFHLSGLKTEVYSEKLRVFCAASMALLTNVAILLVLACISHQLMLSCCQKSHGRRGRGADRGHPKVKPGPRAGRQSKAAPAHLLKGKVVTGDKSECTWAATGDDVFVLGVACKKGDRSFGCEYVARPAACSQYASNVKVYWKQVARALKKHKSLCQDGRASVRAGVCRGAAGEAHFRLRNAQRKTLSPSAAPGAGKSCQPGNRKLAEEHCNDSWSSFCTFFFTMVQDYDC